MTATVRVHVMEDHTLLAETLVAALTEEGFDASRVRFPAASLPERQVAGDALLLDVDGRLGRAAGMDVIASFTTAGARVVALSDRADLLLAAMAVEAGAVGVLSKDISFHDLVQALQRIAEDGSLLSETERARLRRELRGEREAAAAAERAFQRLTPREREVLSAMLLGKSAKTIAGELVVTLATVRTQIRSILTKLGVNSQLEAVAMARTHRWTELISA